MQLEYAFFAEKADRLADQRLCVFGGEIDTLEASHLPVYFQLALVVKLLLFPDEPLEGHNFSIAVTNPLGKRVSMMPAPSPVTTKRNPYDPTLPSGASILINFGIKIEAPGNHHFHIIIDDKELKTLPLYIAKVEQNRKGTPS